MRFERKKIWIEVEVASERGGPWLLTARQQTVLQLTALSLTPGQIGERLKKRNAKNGQKITAKTVEHHRMRAIEILGLPKADAAAITRWCIKHKLISI